MKDQEKFFYQIGLLNALYNGLDEESQRIFLRSLKKNPWAFVFKYPPVETTDLYGFNQFRDYFLYHPVSEDSRLYFIQKYALNKVKRNIMVSMKNEFTLNPKWRN